MGRKTLLLRYNNRRDNVRCVWSQNAHLLSYFMLGFNFAAKQQRVYWAALLIEALAFHRHVLFLEYTFPWDFRGWHVAYATFIADSFRRGEFPLWDPYTFCWPRLSRAYGWETAPSRACSQSPSSHKSCLPVYARTCWRSGSARRPADPVRSMIVPASSVVIKNGPGIARGPSPLLEYHGHLDHAHPMTVMLFRYQ